MKTLLAILAAAMLGGCSTVKMLENRVACSADKQEAYFLSKYGPIAVGSQIAAADAAVVCKTPG